MKTKSFFTTIIVALLLTISFYNCGGGDTNNNGNNNNNNNSTVNIQPGMLPQDVDTTKGTVDAKTFASWFKEGKVTENGFVNPANSVTFPSNDNHDFYLWSEQMFLWLTSQDTKYGTKGSVLESPVFYTVLPESNGIRELEQHKKGAKLNAAGNIGKMVTTEEGQATDNVLLDKNGNLVYYITMVNDVYAVLLNMAAQYPDSVKKFPTTQTELHKIMAFAQKNNISVLEPNALAIELKTSWVEASGLKNPEDFVIVEAIVPTYDKQNDTIWLPKKETRMAKLALVGMHIVGSARNHPEMIWSTFEHKSNTPNAKYQYVNTSGKTINVNPNNSGDWLFNQNPKDTTIANANIRFATFSHPEGTTTPSAITATKPPKTPKAPNAIKPSNTIRTKPWGSAYDVQPNPENKSTAAANSQVIAMNNSVMSKLMGKDVRKNYIFIGSTWTSGGAVPNGVTYNPNKKESMVDSVSIGTSSLANSTMETDFQLTTSYGDAKHLNGHSCFTCHNGTLDPKVDDGLSHIFYPLMNGVKKLAVKKMVEK